MMSPSQPTKKRTPKLKLLAVSSILVLSGLTCIGHQLHQEHRLKKAEQKWQDTQAYAKEMGVELDLNAYADSRKGEGISLIDDHPWFRKMFANWNDTDPKPVELPAFKRGLPDLCYDHEQNILEIRKSLRIDDETLLTDQEVIQRLLTAIQPCNDELDHFKAAVMESNDWGTALHKEWPGFTNVRVVMDFGQRLLVRGYCLLMLGSEDTSDLLAVKRLNNLYKDCSVGHLIDLSFTIATDLSWQRVALAYAYSPAAKSLVIKDLLQQSTMQHYHPAFRRAIRAELATILAMMEDTKDEDAEWLGPIFSQGVLPAHTFLDIRSDYTRFYIDHMIFPHKNSLLTPEDVRSLNRDDPRIAHLDLPSRKLVEMLNIGSSFYYTNCLKSELLNNIMVLALASRAYQLDKGLYPASLEDLSPAYIDQLPLIPYSNTPYTYEPPNTDEDMPNFTAAIQFGDKQIEVNWLYPVEDKY